MVDHKESHINKKFIKVGKIPSGRFKNEYRPIEHTYSESAGEFTFSGKTRLCKVIPPPGVYDNGYLTCKECKFSLPFSEKTNVMPAIQQSAAARKFTNHKCKPK